MPIKKIKRKIKELKRSRAGKKAGSKCRYWSFWRKI